ncbi:uncharacterized protein LOC136075366 [Hydra vulgaris]|uniref:Uncharacterized protein LOC136075366 n=1 Tax=Hydra vulgaris TaxID=6087 RepID=A0ABM4B6B6_HYDVU
MAKNFECCQGTKRRRVRRAVDELLKSVNERNKEPDINNDLGLCYESVNNIMTSGDVEIRSCILDENEIDENSKKIDNNLSDVSLQYDVESKSQLFNSEAITYNLTDGNYSDNESNFSEYSDKFVGSSNDEENVCKCDIRDQLATWVVTHNISTTAVTALLHILWLAGLNVPKDERTLMETPKKVSNIIARAGGSYYYVGVKTALLSALSQLNESTLSDISALSLNINVDGIPLFHSSNMQLWPILGYVNELPKKQVFIIGLYTGKTKPTSVEEYLNDFILEMKSLSEGLEYREKRYDIFINAIICDAPARAFIKCIKGHCGYNGCERCIQEGVHLKYRMTFPDTNSTLRTDADFIVQKDEDHHIALSPLTELPVGLVTQCPLDYMHLVCLGIVRRIISLWIKGDLKNRLSANTVNKISEKLISLKKYFPKEFARRPRSLNEYQQWRATELRQFLLYTGPTILFKLVSDNVYRNFLLLSAFYDIFT